MNEIQLGTGVDDCVTVKCPESQFGYVRISIEVDGAINIRTDDDGLMLVQSGSQVLLYNHRRLAKKVPTNNQDLVNALSQVSSNLDALKQDGKL